MIRLSNPTGRNTRAYVVSVVGSKYYFSYETCIAFAGNVDGVYRRVRLDNHWGPTTGRHFRDLGCNDFEILSRDEYDKLMQRSFSVDFDSLLTDATAEAIRQAASPDHPYDHEGYEAGRQAGIDSAREYIARRIADAIEDRCEGMFKRNEFFRACGTLELG